MKLLFFVCGLLLVAIFWYWAKVSRPDYTKSAPTTPPLAFETLLTTPLSGINDKQTVAITTGDDWENLWTKLSASTAEKSPLPPVNFTQEMLIATMGGTQSSGGYSVLITAIHESGDRLVVSIIETQPGEACLTTSVITTPIHVVKLARNTKPLTIESTIKQESC